MDWDSLGKIDITIGIIQAIWGTLNIVYSFKGYLSRKAKEEYIKQLDKDRIAAEKEHKRICDQCKRATQKTISVLQKSNDQLMTKV